METLSNNALKSLFKILRKVPLTITSFIHFTALPGNKLSLPILNLV